jgi:hypothetical protein
VASPLLAGELVLQALKAVTANRAARMPETSLFIFAPPFRCLGSYRLVDERVLSKIKQKKAVIYAFLAQ